MKYAIKLFTLGFAVFLLASCEDTLNFNKETTNLTGIKLRNSVVGEWDWIKTERYNWIGKYVTTPDSAGFSKLLKIKIDTLKFYINGSLATSYPYEFRYIMNHPAATDSMLTIVFNNKSAVFLIKNDTLILSEAHYDGPTEFYIKKYNTHNTH